MKHFVKEPLEMAIVSALKEFALHPDVIEWLTNMMIECQNKEAESSELTNIKTQLAEAEKAQKNLIAAIEKGLVSKSIEKRLTELEKDIETLSDGLAYYEAVKPKSITKEEMKAFLQLICDGDINDKRYQKMLIDAFLIRAYVYDDKLKLIFNYNKAHNTSEIPFNIDDVIEDSENCTLLATPSPKMVRLNSTQAYHKKSANLWKLLQDWLLFLYYKFILSTIDNPVLRQQHNQQKHCCL